ncbi:PP2C family protein-serine/threonine phosphatase [Planctomycetota bacterium]
MTQKGRFDCHGLTDVGRQREVNQDQFLIADLSRTVRVHQTSLSLDDHTRLFGATEGMVLLVADGVGGAAGGEQASALAVGVVTNYMLRTMHWFLHLDRDDEEDDFVDELSRMMELCHEWVEYEGERVPALRGMGTTLTIAYVLWPRLYVVHVGDSRCYLLRDGQLKQFTRDHTVAQQLADDGVDVNLDTSRWSHVLWNVVGGSSDEALRPEVHKATLAEGDTLLLCSDGLTKHVPDEVIAGVLQVPSFAEAACRDLVQAANDGGGTDNITAVVGRFLPSEVAIDVENAAAESPAVASEESAAKSLAPAPAPAD